MGTDWRAGYDSTAMAMVFITGTILSYYNAIMVKNIKLIYN